MCAQRAFHANKHLGRYILKYHYVTRRVDLEKGSNISPKLCLQLQTVAASTVYFSQAKLDVQYRRFLAHGSGLACGQVGNAMEEHFVYIAGFNDCENTLLHAHKSYKLFCDVQDPHWDHRELQDRLILGRQGDAASFDTSEG